MLMAGTVAGGGLTIIANAPNPAGASLLRRGFNDQSIGVVTLLLGALPPTWHSGCNRYEKTSCAKYRSLRYKGPASSLANSAET